MIRRLNYTGRQRITREDAQITLLPADAGPPRFSARLELGPYELPADAPVFVEAYRQASFMRFDFGAVGALREPGDTWLTEFGTGAAVRFRVKVVEPDGAPGAGQPGRLLALADRLTPLRPQDERAQSLLPVEPSDDLRDQVWKVEFGEGDEEPILYISRRLVPDHYALVGSRQFVTLALPAILREILTEIVLVEKYRDGDPDDWRGQWLRFAASIPGMGPLPADGEEGEHWTWIDGAINAFARQHGLANRFRQWWQENA